MELTGHLYRCIKSKLVGLAQGLCGLLVQVSTETLSGLDCLTFHTRSNRVAIISSVITRIFLTLCNTGTVTFQPVSIKTIMIYIYCACVLVPVIYSLSLFVIYLLVPIHLLFVVNLFCSLFDYLFYCCLFYFSSILVLFVVQKEKRTILILNLCSGILIPLNVHHHQYESIIIIQQTPPTLSQYRSEIPITTIDIAGQMKPISPHSKLQQRARHVEKQIISE